MSLSSLYLDAFYACAQAGHFTKAANEVGITQSALSQRVAKLEDDLGTSLFVRHSTGIQLTPAGLELLHYCKTKELLEGDCLDRISGESSDQLTGVIRIGGFSSVMRSVVLPALTPLLLKYPKIKLSLISKELDELPALLKRGEIDYLIHYNEIDRDEFEAIQIGAEKNVLVEKKGYSGPEIFLDHDERDQVTARYLKLKKNKKKYTRRYLDDVYGLIDGVRAGLGRAIVPEHLISHDKEIKVVDKKDYLTFPVVLHFFKQPYYTELHKQVLTLLNQNKLAI